MKPKSPLDLIADNPRLALLPPVAYGAVWKFISMWWRAGCPELPKSFDYQSISGLKLKAWVYHKTIIMAIIDEVSPLLRLMYQKQALTRQKRIKHMPQAWAKRDEFYKRAKLLKKTGNELISDTKDNHIEIIPTGVSRKRWNEGKYDPVERDKALKNNKTGKERLFTDK